MRDTRFSRSAETAAATARYVFPVPAGPIANTTSLRFMELRYEAWPTVRATTVDLYVLMTTGLSTPGIGG